MYFFQLSYLGYGIPYLNEAYELTLKIEALKCKLHVLMYS